MNKRVKQFAVAGMLFAGAMGSLEYWDKNLEDPKPAPPAKETPSRRVLPTRTFNDAVSAVVEDTGIADDPETRDYKLCLWTHASKYYENTPVALDCSITGAPDKCKELHSLIEAKTAELDEDPAHNNICWDVATTSAFSYGDLRLEVIKRTLRDRGVNISSTFTDAYGRINYVRGRMEDTKFRVNCEFIGQELICSTGDAYTHGYFVGPLQEESFVLYTHEDGVDESALDHLDQGCEVQFIEDFVSQEIDCEELYELFPDCEYPSFCYDDEETGEVDTGWYYKEDTGNYSDMGM